jgi:hypothetical protein
MVERERVSICTMFALFVALYILQTWAKLSVKGTFSTYHCKPSSCSPGQCTSFPVLGNFPVSPRRTKNISDHRGKGYMSSSSTMIMIETLVGRSGVRLMAAYGQRNLLISFAVREICAVTVTSLEY